nr:zinc finger A20 and AN1 domain-containing stress-associated protein 8-like [Ipomoea batatas]
MLLETFSLEILPTLAKAANQSAAWSRHESIREEAQNYCPSLIPLLKPKALRENGNFKDMEQNEAGIQAPVLCVNNYGFFGTVATMNMCSKCYKDTVLKQEQARLAASSIESIMNGSGKSVDVVVVSSHDGSAESSAVTAQDSRTQPENNGGENTKNGPKRCSACRKRVGANGFQLSFRQRRNFIFATDLSNRRRPIARNGYSGTIPRGLPKPVPRAGFATSPLGLVCVQSQGIGLRPVPRDWFATNPSDWFQTSPKEKKKMERADEEGSEMQLRRRERRSGK